MESIQMVDMQEIVPGPNDRHIFDDAGIAALAANIAEHGLIQPITVRWFDGAGCYQIVAGERRYRACKSLGWSEIPAFVKDLSDEEASAIMLAENVSRQDLDPIDEGLAYSYRMSTYGRTIEQVAAEAGATTIRVKFRLKLLNLRVDLQALIRTGDLLIGYAQVLADANLDTNRQLIAIRYLRDNPHPTPSWFRRICNDLLSAQAQSGLFEAPLFGQQAAAISAKPVYTEPPHPATTKPPKSGKTPKEILGNQVGFWDTAADAWDALGKPFKRQECQAASMALQSAMSFV